MSRRLRVTPAIAGPPRTPQEMQGVLSERDGGAGSLEARAQELEGELACRDARIAELTSQVSIRGFPAWLSYADVPYSTTPHCLALHKERSSALWCTRSGHVLCMVLHLALRVWHVDIPYTLLAVDLRFSPSLRVAPT